MKKKFAGLLLFLGLILMSVSMTSCLSYPLDLSTIDPHVHIGSVSRPIQKDSPVWDLLAGKDVSDNIVFQGAVSFLTEYADRELDAIAAHVKEKAGIILDVEGFKEELRRSTPDNIKISEGVGNTGVVVWESNPNLWTNPDPFAAIMVRLVNKKSEGMIFIFKYDPETETLHSTKIE